MAIIPLRLDIKSRRHWWEFSVFSSNVSGFLEAILLRISVFRNLDYKLLAVIVWDCLLSSIFLSLFLSKSISRIFVNTMPFARLQSILLPVQKWLFPLAIKIFSLGTNLFLFFPDQFPQRLNIKSKWMTCTFLTWCHLTQPLFCWPFTNLI